MEYNKLNPLDELIFKQIFCTADNQSSLISLLDSILNLQGNKQIYNISKIESKKLEEETIADKSWTLGIEAYTLDKCKLDVEIQLTDKKEIVDTALFCLSRLYVDSQSDNLVPQRSILIIFLDYQYFDNEEFHTLYHFRDHEHSSLLSDKLELHFIELPKFHESTKELSNPFHRWLSFLDNSIPDELIDSIKEDNHIKKVIEKLENIRNNSNFINIYNAREKIINEYHQLIKNAEEKGLKRGLEIGKREGLESGAIKAYREAILDVLKDYGVISKEVKEIVKNNEDLTLLKEWYTIARFSGSSQEFLNEI